MPHSSPVYLHFWIEILSEVNIAPVLVGLKVDASIFLICVVVTLSGGSVDGGSFDSSGACSFSTLL